MKTFTSTVAIAAICLAFHVDSTHLVNAQRQVAITIDDLPDADMICNPQQIVSNTEKILAPLQRLRVPVIGFVIGSRCPNLTTSQKQSILKMWLHAGAELGNHTWTHPDLNDISFDAFEAEILQTDKDLHRLLDPATFRYFRAPYLHDGENLEAKARLQSFLHQYGYLEAPVTFDTSDWTFANAYVHALKAHNTTQAKAVLRAYIPYMESNVEYFEQRSVDVLGRECPQVLLIHASRLNAEMMPALLAMFQARGYSFVTLQAAMSDPAYQIADTYEGKNGLSWIHRWGVTMGKPIMIEPDPPSWIVKLAKN